jgi:hypothetical protein
MSDATTPSASVPSKASGDGSRVAIATWAPLAVSVISLTIFTVAYTFAYLGNDEKTLTLMAGAAIAMAQSGMNYWTSSTSGSRAKDDRQADQLDRQAAALAASVPVAAMPIASVVPPPPPTGG